MQTPKTNTIILIVLWLGTLAVALFFAFKKPEPAPYDETLINTRINILEQENDRLEQDIAAERKKTALFIEQMDSIAKIKQTVVVKYVKIYEKIDASTAVDVVNEFDSVFTASALK